MAVKQLQIAFFALLRSWQGPRWRCFSATSQAIHPSKNNHIIHWSCSLPRIMLGQVGGARIWRTQKTQSSEKCVIEMKKKKKKNERRGVIAFKFWRSYLKCFFFFTVIFFFLSFYFFILSRKMDFMTQVAKGCFVWCFWGIQKPKLQSHIE